MAVSGRETVETEFYFSDARDSAARPLAPDCHVFRPRPRRRRRRLSLMEQGVDPDVLAVLDTRFQIGAQAFTLLDVAGNDAFLSVNTNQPGVVVIQALESALQLKHLSIEQKKKLFEILEWQFECLACHQPKPPSHYDSSSYILWGASNPPQPKLRSGPCIVCKEVAKTMQSPHRSGIVVYSVNRP